MIFKKISIHPAPNLSSYQGWTGNLIGGKTAKIRQKDAQLHPFQLLGFQQKKHQANNSNKYAEDVLTKCPLNVQIKELTYKKIR